MICNNCGNEMRKLEKTWVCEECRTFFPVNKFDKNDWSYKEDGNVIKWLDSIDLNNMPYVIAHEYHRIKVLIDERQPYGAMLQLKDAYECIVKFLVLKECARIYKKDNKCDKEIIILKTLTEKLLLLSHWKCLMADIIELIDVDTETKNVLSSLIQLLQDNPKVIEWRNRVIGHGALGFADSIENKNEFYTILEKLTMHLEKYKVEYMNMKLGITTKSASSVEALSGININIDFNKYDIDDLVIAKNDEVYINLYPFIFYFENNIFFFDSFSSGKKCTDIISYTLGKKIEIRKNSPIWSTCEVIHQLHNMCQQEFKKRDIIDLISKSSTSIDDNIFYAETEKWLLESYSINDSVKTIYLQKWLQEKVKDDKGIYLFQAHAGTGKTISTMQLEGRINNRIALANTTVKAIYINESNNKLGYIIDKIELAFTTGENGENIIRQVEKSYIDVVDNVSDRKKSLAKYLNNMKMKLSSIGKCDLKLLVIFDGVDELSDEDLNFLDYIPEVGQLNAGIYILVTSRINSEISINKLKKLKSITFTDTLVKNPEDEDLYKMHEEYIVKQLSGISDDDITKIKNFGDKSFLQIYLATFMINNKMLYIDELSCYDSTYHLIDKYLEYLKGVYGEKNVKLLYKVIYLLGSDMRYRSLEEISHQIGEYKVSFFLIGILHDLRAILEVNHKIIKVFRVNHENKKDAINLFLKQNNEMQTIEEEILNIWSNIINEISYWNEEELLEHQECNSTINLDSMLNLSPKEFYFMKMFFNHPMSKDTGKWENAFPANSYLVILEKLFGGPNGYLASKEWAQARMMLAENMSDFMYRQSELTEDETLKGTLLITYEFCRSFMSWRKWFSRLKWTGELKNFKSEKSQMHETYSLIWEFYCEAKKETEEKGLKYMSQGMYNFLILLEEACLKMIVEFIDFYSELEIIKAEEKWVENKLNIHHNSVKLYDKAMSKYVEFQEFYSLYQYARIAYKNNNEKLRIEYVNKANSIKYQILTYDLKEFEKLSIQREELYSELEFNLYRDIKQFKYIESNTVRIGEKLVGVIEKQIAILRNNDDEGTKDDVVSEAIWHSADTMNEFVMAGMIVNRDQNITNTLKMAKMANNLYELLSEKMQNYYLLQRVNIVANYVLILNYKKIFEERNKYLDWYLLNKEEIIKGIQLRAGKICEMTENSVRLLDATLGLSKNESIEKNNLDIFEIHKGDNGTLRARCMENYVSGEARVLQNGNGIIVKFKKIFCNNCEYTSCPAYTGIHEVLIKNLENIIDDTVNRF